jgi:glycosyltransferase involved in cell wall biosynthesis
MTPVISVIIPTYRHRDYVLATIDSVFSQSFKDFEVIVVDDGSTDGTAALLRPLVERKMIRYFRQENAGQARARNTGLEAASGEFIALLDDDDLFPEDKLRWQVELMRSNAEIVMIAGLVGLIENGEMTRDHKRFDGLTQELSVAKLFEGSPFYSPGQTLIRAGPFRRIGGLDTRIWGADDYDLYTRLATVGKVVLVNRLALHYRVHADNASRDSVKLYWNSLQALKKNYCLVPLNNRRSSRRAAYRWLANLLAWRAMQGGSWLKSLRIVMSLSPAAIRDKLLLRQMLQQFAKTSQLRIEQFARRKSLTPPKA